MTNERLIEIFYNELPTMKNLYIYKVQLKDLWDDVLQDSAIKLIKYNDKHNVDESTVRGLIFVTIKNTSISQLQKLTLKDNDSYEDVLETLPTEDYDMDDDEFIVTYRKKLLELISIDEYNFLLQYYHDRLDNTKVIPKSQSSKHFRIKAKMGYKYTFELILNDNKYEFNTIGQISDFLGLPNNGYLYAIITRKGCNFKLNDDNIIIRRKTNIK